MPGLLKALAMTGSGRRFVKSEYRFVAFTINGPNARDVALGRNVDP